MLVFLVLPLTWVSVGEAVYYAETSALDEQTQSKERVICTAQTGEGRKL